MGRHTPTVKRTFNPKINKITYRIGKEGVPNQYLLFGIEEVAALIEMLTETSKGDDNELRRI